MRKSIMKRMLAAGLCASMLFGAGCGGGAQAGESLPIGGVAKEPGAEESGEAADGSKQNRAVLSEPDYVSEKISYAASDKKSVAENARATEENKENDESASSDILEKLPEDARPITDFGVALLQNAVKGEAKDKNILVSPLSILMALAMTANGAEGETKAQMDAVLGEQLNTYLRDYRAALPYGDEYKLHLANAIWFKEDEKLQVKESFLRTNAEYFDAAMYKAAFNETTVKDINQWVEYHTDGMIQKILDQITPEAALYLVNALSFDAEWSTIYKENEIRPGEFTKEDGSVQQVELMYSTEERYLEDELATGFLKYYHGDKYAFVALLPKEGISVDEYVAGLIGEHLETLLANPSVEEVQVRIPKFETEYSAELNDMLMQMGMVDAFDREKADFSAMATVPPEWNLSISKVLHKTFISVDERGTRAGAATVVQMDCTTSSIGWKEPKKVYLNRPFVYMIIDCEMEEPVFIGTMMDVEK